MFSSRTTLAASDDANRQLTATDPLGNIVSNVYDANGNVTSSTRTEKCTIRVPLSSSQPVNTGPFKGSWPDEDQTHHFAGYFYSGALLQLSPYGGDSHLVKALMGTGDYYVKINGVQTIANSGDYDLGVVGWDMGVAYEKNKSNISSTINSYLTRPCLKTVTNADNPP